MSKLVSDRHSSPTNLRCSRRIQPEIAKRFKSKVLFWFSLSLTFAAMYGLLGLRVAFSSEYVVQDDARQHVFWMWRFLDPELFPNDLIADYFQSVAPLGYSTLYRLFATVGIDPILLSKFLPIVLGLITTGYCFGVCLQLFAVPIAGFIASLLLNQYLWLQDDLVSATAVAFVYPLFMAFLYYLLRRSLIPCLVAIALLGLFYPQYVFICAGILILQMLHWESGRLYLSKNHRDFRLCATGLGVALVVMSLYALKYSRYGPVIAATEARGLPEFSSTGLSKFFIDNPWEFWFTGRRSGIMPNFGTIVPLVAGLLLPVLLLYPSRFPLLKQLTKDVALLLQITLASLGMFFVSHALLFRLHLPSRYTEHSLRIVTAIAAGIALTIIFDALLYWAQKQAKLRLLWRQFLVLAAAALFGAALVLHPSFLKQFPKTDYIVGGVPPLYEFFAQQPKDILIASLANEVNNLPSFAKREILVGGQGYPVPYHKGYYTQIRQRTIDLINAQYSSDLNQVKRFIQKYGVDFWLLEQTAFTPEFLTNRRTKGRWIRQYQPAATEALALLEQGKIPALYSVIKRCSVFKTGSFVVLQASCIAKVPPG